MQHDEKDWIVRQVKAFGQGLGYLLSHGKSKAGTEIVFPQKDASLLPHQKELQILTNQKKYSKAVVQLKILRYSMEEEKYLELGRWLYGTLLQLDESQLQEGNYLKDFVAAGLKELNQIELEMAN
ncbi:DUF6483 family protein [Xylocopilactobacillus apis]|uniref:Uncharacterized protein n=1 Tax=Xylocopilactobacillus apis TaxID=2932183 RepID=A0AAU9D5K6_9LACO|nr:DUF6483 family protein [Xylocopilactobacillus apis]BDR56695.1 hypothetical protein KIMC2_12570 [Xylocopilactobacillus apis]